jgi:hypothetical protein
MDPTRKSYEQSGTNLEAHSSAGYEGISTYRNDFVRRTVHHLEKLQDETRGHLPLLTSWWRAFLPLHIVFF